MILRAFLRDYGKNKATGSVKAFVLKKIKKSIKFCRAAAYPNVIRRHGLQVILKRLPPFDGGLELVHFDQVVCNRKDKSK